MKLATSVLLLSVLLFTACQEKKTKSTVLDTPTTGSITIIADESLRPLVETEVETFNGIYRYADIKVVYAPEADVMNNLLKNDSLQLAVVTRKLTVEEKKYFDEIKIIPIERNVAGSAIALIVHPENPDSVISIDQIKGILRGEIKTWNQLNGRSKNGIEIVFDNPNSGVIRVLKDSIAKVEKLPANCFAVKTNEGVVDYVSENENAIGLIGVEWISDDPVTNTFLNKIKVMGVAGDSTHIKPYQAYLAMKIYPLPRTIVLINRAGRTGLATGFSSFVESERGQRIILKTGLVPIKMPIRIVEINREPFEVTK